MRLQEKECMKIRSFFVMGKLKFLNTIKKNFVL